MKLSTKRGVCNALEMWLLRRGSPLLCWRHQPRPAPVRAPCCGVGVFDVCVFDVAAQNAMQSRAVQVALQCTPCSTCRPVLPHSAQACVFWLGP